MEPEAGQLWVYPKGSTYQAMGVGIMRVGDRWRPSVTYRVADSEEPCCYTRQREEFMGKFKFLGSVE